MCIILTKVEIFVRKLSFLDNLLILAEVLGARGYGPSGISFPKNLQSGSQPSLALKTSNLSAGTLAFTYSSQSS